MREIRSKLSQLVNRLTALISPLKHYLYVSVIGAQDGSVFGRAVVEAGVIVGSALHLEEVDAALVVQDGLGVRADEEDGVVDLDLGVGLVGEEALRRRRGDGRARFHLEIRCGDM